MCSVVAVEFVACYGTMTWIYSLFWNIGFSENGHIDFVFSHTLDTQMYVICPLFYASYTFGVYVSKCYCRLNTAMVNSLLLNTIMSDFCLIITMFGNIFLD